MNIEDLTKTQLLLLTILVNFVTSIATGVLTVSLLDQAPPTVIQTVNRIVDHTIETVTTEVPVLGNNTSGPTTEELLTSAIADVSARSVRILRTGSENQIATGVLIPATRSVFTVDSLPGTVAVSLPDGSVAEAKDTANESGIRRYELSADAVIPPVPSAKLVASSDLKQGQTVIALSSSGAAVTGIVTLIDTLVTTDLPGIPAGAGVVNLSGDIIGVSLGDGRVLPSERLSAMLALP